MLLALSIPSAYLLSNRMGLRLCTSISNLAQRKKQRMKIQTPNNGVSSWWFENGEAEDGEQTPLLTHQQSEGLWARIMRIWDSSTSPQLFIMGSMTLAYYPAESRTLRSSWKQYANYAATVALAILFSLLTLALCFALVISTVLSANIITDSAVLSSHPDCGVWEKDASISTPSSHIGHDYLEEVEAAEYAKKCYHSTRGTDGCNTFFTQKNSYYAYHDTQCPFEDSLCLDGRLSAYKMYTSLVSSKDLGINVEIGYTFRRSTTCSPIKRRASLSEDRKTYVYDYGPSTEFGNFSWASIANPVWEFAGYNVA